MTTLLTVLVLAVISILAIRHLLRTFFYPLPAEMPDTVEADAATALDRFERALAEHNPEVLLMLQPGLSEDQIAAIEVAHRLRLTKELRALYRWRNGTIPAERAELIPGHRFVPLEEAVQRRVGLRDQLAAAPLIQRIAYAIFAGHRSGWLVVLDDLAGDGYFYDPARGGRGGNFFYHFAEDRQYRFFPSLANFLVGAAECYETGVYRDGRRGKPSEDFDRSFALWPRYASWSSE